MVEGKPIEGSKVYCIAYLTSRLNPRFQWFADSLKRQVEQHGEASRPQVIVVDSKIDEREFTPQDYFPGWGCYHVEPKPCIWQGKYRWTKRDYFAAANARNTAALYADRPYIVFVDDLSVLCDGWLDQVLHAVEHRYVVGGAYKKVQRLQVENGVVTSYDEFPKGVDSRWSLANETNIVKIGGGQLFGCSFGCPLEDYIAVNGQDEICDSLGGEDYNFGIRIERLGKTIWYNRNMLTLESEEAHYEEPPYLRLDKATPGNPDGHDSSHIVLNRTLRGGVWTQGNHYNLASARKAVRANMGFPAINAVETYFDGVIAATPSTHFPDGQPIREM